MDEKVSDGVAGFEFGEVLPGTDPDAEAHGVDVVGEGFDAVLGLLVAGLASDGSEAAKEACSRSRFLSIFLSINPAPNSPS